MSGPRSVRRWPLAPLLHACRPERQRPDPFSPAADPGPVDPYELLARRLRMQARDVRHAAAAGLTDAQADRWAVRAGWHPACIWGWDAWAATGLDPYQVGHLVPEARQIAAEITASGRTLRKTDVIAELRARGVTLSKPRAIALWQRLRADLADPDTGMAAA